MIRDFELNFKRCLAVALGALLMGVTLSAAAKDKEIPSALRVQIDTAIARVKPALVRIRVVSTGYEDGRETKMQEVGSGAIITKDGYIITNHHVAGHAARMFCTLWNREEVEAEVIGTDPLTDISIIKLKPEHPRDFTPVGFGDSVKLRVGDYVLAMGSPMALSQSVTLGIISNTEMIMPRFWGSSGRFRLDGEDVGSLVRWIGHDAAIYGGNSGGPLVNLQGDIIGINEISYGLSGAIPGNVAKSVADQIMAKGKVQRSWLGVDAQPLFKRLKDEKGVFISGVLDGSPADKGGMKPGDLLLRLGGNATDVRFDEQMTDFMWMISTLPIGKEVAAVVRRDGKEVTLHLTPAERSELFPKQQELKQWGVTVRNFSFLLAKEMKRTNLDGVEVTSVRPGGPAGAAKPSIDSRDVIVEVNGTPVKNVQDLIDVTHKLTEGKTEPVAAVAVFERKAERFLAVVKVGIQDLKDPGLEVTKAWLPVETHVISREIAAQLGQPSLKGCYITRVYSGSTADKAGLKSGDFIIALDGDKLTASGSESEDELSTLIRQYDVGKTVELTVLRNKTETKIPVELSRSPRLSREMKKYRNDDFEFTARDVSFFDAADEQWNNAQHGALVEDVKTGSWAELGTLYAGDLILEIDGQPVDNVDMLRHRMEQVAAGKKNVVVMKVLRGIHTAYLEIEPNWKS
ncbi:MAG: Trypsin-like serine protease, typically periplasmic, containing C-terminal domain [Pedosphaera sp.]|nr:Trypsin-like serine protease, typically periplasmic, containing C-terminal domain [Pedosphaera sp.]